MQMLQKTEETGELDLLLPFSCFMTGVLRDQSHLKRVDTTFVTIPATTPEMFFLMVKKKGLEKWDEMKCYYMVMKLRLVLYLLAGGDAETKEMSLDIIRIMSR